MKTEDEVSAANGVVGEDVAGAGDAGQVLWILSHRFMFVMAGYD